MRRIGFLAAIGAFAVAVAGHSWAARQLGILGGATAGGNGAQSSAATGVHARIARIESGLLPAVIIKGQTPQRMTVADRMKHHRVSGMSVAFFAHGRIAWTKCYGVADLTSKKPVTPETLFQAASISKPIGALAALRLVRESKLRLDEDVNAKLRTWKVPENEFTKEQKVTLRRILSHSAGLTVHGFPGYAAGETLPTIVQILNGEKPANTPAIRVDTIPGTLWRYSGGGYVVMQLLLTDVTGEPFPKIVHDLVLQPAGMRHSTYEQPLPKTLWPSAATPYRSNGEPVKGGWHTYPEMAPAGLWTTPSDLARAAIEVQEEYAGKSDKILSQQLMQEMLTRQKDDWGLGFALEAPGHTPRFGHGGANEGFRSDLEAYREEGGEGVAIMTNSDSGDQLASEYLRAVAHEYHWPDFQPKERTLAKIDASMLSSYAGVYDVPNVVKLTVAFQQGKLYVQAEPLGPEPEELFPASATEFFILSQDSITFDFEKDTGGAVSKLILHAGPQNFEAKRTTVSR